jgi:hypothetical protein
MVKMADITDLDCVSTADFEALKLVQAQDVRNLDVAWIILCSKCTAPREQASDQAPAHSCLRAGLGRASGVVAAAISDTGCPLWQRA